VAWVTFFSFLCLGYAVFYRAGGGEGVGSVNTPPPPVIIVYILQSIGVSFGSMVRNKAPLWNGKSPGRGRQGFS
jgi:hypothetical protein